MAWSPFSVPQVQQVSAENARLEAERFELHSELQHALSNPRTPTASIPDLLEFPLRTSAPSCRELGPKLSVIFSTTDAGELEDLVSHPIEGMEEVEDELEENFTMKLRVNRNLLGLVGGVGGLLMVAAWVAQTSAGVATSGGLALGGGGKQHRQRVRNR